MQEITIVVPNWFMIVVSLGLILSTINTLTDIHKMYKKK